MDIYAKLYSIEYAKIMEARINDSYGRDRPARRSSYKKLYALYPTEVNICNGVKLWSYDGTLSKSSYEEPDTCCLIITLQPRHDDAPIIFNGGIYINCMNYIDVEITCAAITLNSPCNMANIDTACAIIYDGFNDMDIINKDGLIGFIDMRVCFDPTQISMPANILITRAYPGNSSLIGIEYCSNTTYCGEFCTKIIIAGNICDCNGGVIIEINTRHELFYYLAGCDLSNFKLIGDRLVCKYGNCIPHMELLLPYINAIKSNEAKLIKNAVMLA